MGQYYMCVNLDKRECIDPIHIKIDNEDFGIGMKLMEHNFVGNSVTNLAMKLLSPNNYWHKTRIVWAGDYMDNGEFFNELENLVFDKKKWNLYNIAEKYFNLKNEKCRFIEKLKYIVNHTKKEYVDISKCPKSLGDMIVHPLPLLTCPSIGGGGSYHSPAGEKYLGTWAGEVLSAEYQQPKEYKEIKPDFVE